MAQLLTSHGWTDAHALAGGFDAWMNAGYPVEPKYADERDRAA